MMPSGSRAGVVVGLLALLATGCPEGGTEKAPARAGADAIEVATTKPERRDVAKETRLPVELWPWQRVALVAKVTGYVGTVAVDRGSLVKEGDLLTTVAVPELEDEKRKKTADVNVIEAEIKSARASYELQKVTAKRFENLVTENAISVQELDEARAREAVAQAAIAQAESKLVAAQESLKTTETWLSYATIASPFSGVVTERLVHPGSFVSAVERTPLFTVMDGSTIRAVVDVPEADAPRVHPGKTAARVTIPELGRTWRAVVSRSASSLDPRTRTLRIEVDLENKTGELIPGMYGEATLVLELHRDVLALPSGAVARSGSEAFVFVIGDGKAKRTAVTTGLDDGKVVEVGGLDPGSVVAAQALGLRDGASVKPPGAKGSETKK
jgi:RND family efflux transporter MFP subunit